MMRALWTAASGMTTQQTNVDTISNNIANINTTGYKKEQAQFKALLYQTLQETATDSEGNIKPVGVQVGSGVRTSAITSIFGQGTTAPTENTFDFAIEGTGFFQVQRADGTIGYTRNGNFQVAIGMNGLTLADASGNLVLDINGEPIIFDSNMDISSIVSDKSGNLSYKDENGKSIALGSQIGIVQFSNPAGLNKTSDSMYAVSDASGEPMLEVNNDALTKSTLKQGYLESSNVTAVDEMVNLIVAQRAYEMNSKAITAADEMLQQANNLR